MEAMGVPVTEDTEKAKLLDVFFASAITDEKDP